jgi:tetratricopeptide (TPR) repeat protein
MPPSDNTPDFESMTPEELQAWMETLADRQGATEGFTTDKRMEIDEIDPDSVEVEDKYIPYGKTAEEWKEIQEREQAEREARKAQQSQASSPAEPAVEEPVPSEPPPPTPATAAGGTPDFESMTPEELQAWMETLADRQGATEGFTTDTRMEIDEIDPDSVEIEDKYIPYGKTAEEWKEIQEREQAEREARKARKAQATPPPAPAVEEQAQPEEEPATPQAMDWLSDLASGGDDEQAEAVPQMDLSGLGGDIAEMEDFDMDALADMEFDQDLDLESLDLGGLAEGDTDPMEWLDGLVEEDEPAFDLPTGDVVAEQAPVEEPPELPQLEEDEDDTDTLEWLESLAKQQGADADEFVTRAEMDVPEVEDDPLPFDAIGDMDDSDDFDALEALDDPAINNDDPSAWLDQLAESQKFTPPDADIPDEAQATDAVDEPNEDDEAQVLADLDRGISDPDAMRGWMDNLLERGLQRDDVPDYIDSDDEDDNEDEALQANLPDWLLEQVGNAPPELSDQPADDDDVAAALNLDQTLDEAAPTPDWLSEEIDENEQVATGDAGDMPDWLQEEIEGDNNAGDIEMPDWLTEDLEEESDDLQAIFSQPELDRIDDDDSDIDTTDSWVEAFELERRMQKEGLEEIPESWLEDGPPDDTETIATPPAALAEVIFEADDLPAGEPESIPEWMDTTAPAPSAVETQTDEADDTLVPAEMPDWLQESAPAEDEAMPDWLAESDTEATADVPDWLLGTVTDEHPAVAPQQPEPKSPAPVVASNINPDEALQAARQKIGAGDIDAALQDYEAVVRVNEKLDDVTTDLRKAVKDGPYKHTAGVHRVLGDALMRQGKLQDALDTYRKALNLL